MPFEIKANGEHVAMLAFRSSYDRKKPGPSGRLPLTPGN
jgi:hypothetical protein